MSRRARLSRAATHVHRAHLCLCGSGVSDPVLSRCNREPLALLPMVSRSFMSQNIARNCPERVPQFPHRGSTHIETQSTSCSVETMSKVSLGGDSFLVRVLACHGELRFYYLCASQLDYSLISPTNNISSRRVKRDQ